MSDQAFYHYTVFIQAQGSDVREVGAIDTRTPAQVHRAWIAASATASQRVVELDRAALHADLRNEMVRKRAKEGIVDPEEIELDDVSPPPDGSAKEDEQLRFAGRPDGTGWLVVVAGLVMGIACEGPDRGPD